MSETTSKILITCANRNNPYLVRELEAMGFSIERNEKYNVSIQGTFEDTLRLNMHLRTANRVLYMIRGFKAHKPDVLYDELVRIPWEKYIYEDGYIHISSSVKNDFINDTRFANLKVKDAIVDRMVRQTGVRPDSGKDRARACLYLFWHNDNCAIYLDTSGETLAKHGYRKIPHSAPLIEALASSILSAANYDGQTTFVNPMCGSGTLAIEAALLAQNRSPGLNRENFSFMHFKNYRPDEWKKIKKEAEQNIDQNSKVKIIATDIDPEAIKKAKINASYAGVEKSIEWKVCDFRETPIPEGGGKIIFNPEYGERLGEIEELEEQYGQIGDFMKTHCDGYEGYIFTGNLDLAKKVGLRAKRRIEFYNARIDCRLLEYELYKGTKRTIDPDPAPSS